MAPLNDHSRKGIALVVLLILLWAMYVIYDRTHMPAPVMSLPIQPSYQISSEEIVRGRTDEKQAIFTFDGGATAESGDKILEVLAKHHVKGTFFLTGKFIESYPDLVKRIVAGGNEVFSHTYSHPHLTEVSDDEIRSELARVNGAFLKLTNLSMKPFFRAPYGDRDDRVLRVAYDAGYESVYWSADAKDWEEGDGRTADQTESAIMENLSPGVIYLMHVGDTITGKILDHVFTEIESRGYKLNSLTQGIAQPL